MPLLLAGPGLAAVALVSAVAGAGGFASLVLLAAIAATSVRLIAAVGDVAERRGDGFRVATSAGGLACLVAAGALHAPLLVLGVFPCLGLEWLGSVVARPRAVAGTVEPVEAPVSRAA